MLHRAYAMALAFGLLPGAATPIAPENPNGLALVYGEFPAQQAHNRRGDTWMIDATVTLPARANKDWYAAWIMLIGYAADGTGPDFVQLGLIRNPNAGNELHAFMATQQWPAAPAHPAQRPPLAYRDLGRVDDVPHLLVIAQTRDGITFAIDRKQAFQNTAIAIGNPFAQAGAETHAAGDTLAGSIASLRLWSNGDVVTVAPSQTLPSCTVRQFGGVIEPLPSGELQFSGIVDPKQPAIFADGCRSILRAHAAPSST